MNLVNDSFFFAHAMEIRLLIAAGAVVVGFALIKVATLVGDVAAALRTGAKLQLETNELATASVR